MPKTQILIIASLLAVWMLPLNVVGQPSISGDLSGILGPGTYIVEGNCTVQFGNGLTIEPGTTFLFAGHYSFTVYGQLNADGTETDSIKFIRQFPTEECRHGGVRFQSGSSENSTLSYCWIDHAKNQDFPFYFGGGIYCSNVAITISNCRISKCKAERGAGLYAINAPVTITACVFEANLADVSGGGIQLHRSDGAEVSYCVIYENTATGT